MMYRRILNWTKNLRTPHFTSWFCLCSSKLDPAFITAWVFSLVTTFTSSVILGKLCSSFHSSLHILFSPVGNPLKLLLRIVRRAYNKEFTLNKEDYYVKVAQCLRFCDCSINITFWYFSQWVSFKNLHKILPYTLSPTQLPEWATRSPKQAKLLLCSSMASCHG